MAFDKFVWVSISLGFVQVYMDLYKFLWVSIGLYGFVRGFWIFIYIYIYYYYYIYIYEWISELTLNTRDDPNFENEN